MSTLVINEELYNEAKNLFGKNLESVVEILLTASLDAHGKTIPKKEIRKQEEIADDKVSLILKNLTSTGLIHRTSTEF